LSAVQEPLAHVDPTHRPLQHSEACAQAAPAVPQAPAGAAHCPVRASQSALQQSPFERHAAPFATHAPPSVRIDPPPSDPTLPPEPSAPVAASLVAPPSPADVTTSWPHARKVEAESIAKTRTRRAGERPMGERVALGATARKRVLRRS
jgi:hypothetical protein